jgi:hypothetical protein
MFGDILSSAVSIWNAEKNRDAAAESQKHSQEFSERMSNTTYQRMIDDLNKAGLSPMLAYSKQGTAPTGSPVTGTSSIEAPKFGETSLRQSQAALAKEQLEVAKSQAQLNTNTAFKAAADANLSEKQAENVQADTDNKKLFPFMSEAQIKELTERSGLHVASAGKVRQDVAIDKPREAFATEEPGKAKWLDPAVKVMHTVLQGLGLMRGSAAMPFVTQSAPRGKK